MNASVTDLAMRYQDYMVTLRRTLHAQPELSFEEQSTSQLVQRELHKMNIPFELAGDYGVVATIKGTDTSRVVALRADMDALPIHEENEHLDYCSKTPSVMHACGHDGHVAMLLGAAQVFQHLKNEMPGTVKLCFQHAEERGGGTAEILKALAAIPGQKCLRHSPVVRD